MVNKMPKKNRTLYYARLGRKYARMLKKAQKGRRRALASQKRYERQREREYKEMMRKKVKAIQSSPALINYRRKLRLFRNKRFVFWLLHRSKWKYLTLSKLKQGGGYGTSYSDVRYFYREYLKHLHRIKRKHKDVWQKAMSQKVGY